jgi:DNA topoisomerase-2
MCSGKKPNKSVSMILLKRTWYDTLKMEYERSTPSLIDGLKLEQRKVLFTVLNRNDKDVNFARLALSVADHTAYYEPGSLMRTIMWMAQDFVGSNNVSLLIPNGQFGTRHQVFY